jgi:hypothetical protein
MGEAKWREIAGPFGYESGYYRLSDIYDCLLSAHAGSVELSQRAYEVIQCVNKLAGRMQDKSLKPMLCMSCDHEFAHNEPPTEIVICFSWANPGHLPILCPVCAVCAGKDEAIKSARLKTTWSKLSPGGVQFYTSSAEA